MLLNPMSYFPLRISEDVQDEQEKMQWQSCQSGSITLGRKGRCTQWSFMDVTGAFNNVHRKRLAHNLRKRRVPEFIVKWTESFLQNHHTRLQFNGVES